MVDIVKGDASWFSRRIDRGKEESDWDVILVDPPRMGLGEDVVKCVKGGRGGFKDMIYIR